MSMHDARYFNSAKRIHKDYNNKNLYNPYNKNRTGRQAPGKLGTGFKISCFLILAAIGVLIWALYFSQLFDIRNIEITGLARVSSEDIKNMVNDQEGHRRFWLVPEDNLLAFDKNKIASDLQAKYNFAALSVKRGIFNHTLKIIITEREFAYIWGEKDAYHYIDKDGYIIQDIQLLLQTATPLIVSASPTSTAAGAEPATSTAAVPAAAMATASTTLADIATASARDQLAFSELQKVLTDQQDKYPIIFNDGDDQISGGRVIIDHSYFDFIQKITDDFNDPKNMTAGLVADYFMLGQEFNTVTVQLNSGLIVKFNVSLGADDWNKQISNLFLLRTDLKDQFYKKIKHKIDLRYGDKVYYE